MFRLVYRQRRRLLFAALFMALAIYTFIASAGISFGHGHAWIDMLVPVLTGLVAGLVVIFILAVALPILPAWRHIGELVSIMMLIEFCLAVPFPDYFGVYSTSGWSTLLWFVIFVCLYSTLYGTWLDRFPMWLGWKSSRSVVLPMSAEKLWPIILPGKGSVDQHWDRLLVSSEADPADPDSFELRYAHGSGLFEHVAITYLEAEPFVRAKYYFQGEVDASNKSLVDGTYEVWFEERADGRCKVTISETRNALLPRIGLNCWFDDYLGDYIDHLRAVVLNRSDWSLAGRYRRKAVSLS